MASFQTNNPFAFTTPHSQQHPYPTLPNSPPASSKSTFKWPPPNSYTNIAPKGIAVPTDGPTGNTTIQQAQNNQNPTSLGRLVPHKPCPACDLPHPRGSCPLKIAGVEYCPLCGLAHYGSQRTCPHINSETQVREMLAALKSSSESKELVTEAKRYLSGVKGTLVQRKKMERQKREYERGRGGELDRESGVKGFGYLAEATGFRGEE